jgi:NADPH:quinone reductase-like Zn-dependent oxidoreductase
LLERVDQLVPNGVDAGLDCIGNGTLERTSAVHGAGTRVLSIADSGPGITTVYARHAAMDLAKLVELVETSQLVVRIGGVYPLKAAAEAQTALRDRSVPGKVVLVVS